MGLVRVPVATSHRVYLAVDRQQDSQDGGEAKGNCAKEDADYGPPPATSRLLHTHGTAHAWRGSLVTPLGSFATLRSRRLVYCRQAMMAKLQTQQHHGVRHFSDEHERQHIGWLNRHFLHNNGFNSDITRPHLTFSPWTSSSP